MLVNVIDIMNMYYVGLLFCSLYRNQAMVDSLKYVLLCFLFMIK